MRVDIVGGVADEEEAAAAIAAVIAALDEDGAAEPDEAPAPRRGWHASARLMVQGLLPTRVPAAATWGHVERLRRAGRGGSGILGQ